MFICLSPHHFYYTAPGLCVANRRPGNLTVTDVFMVLMRLENQEQVVRWIPVIVPLLAVLLTVSIYVIYWAVLA